MRSFILGVIATLAVIYYMADVQGKVTTDSYKNVYEGTKTLIHQTYKNITSKK